MFVLLFVFLRQHPQHMEGPRPGVKSELQLSTYTTATATSDPSWVCNLHHSSSQRRILNPLSKARDGTCILMDTSQICSHWAITGTPDHLFLIISSSVYHGHLVFLLNSIPPQSWKHFCYSCCLFLVHVPNKTNFQKLHTDLSSIFFTRQPRFNSHKQVSNLHLYQKRV